MKMLTICLFLVLLLAAVFAVSANAAETVASGTCGADGDNLTWTLDDEGTLTISGTGAMFDYSYKYENDQYIVSTPWSVHISDLTTLMIGSSVTSIGSHAFYGCSGLTSITIPESVTSIGSNAFSGCSGLTSITIPDNVTNIGGAAFNNCVGLTSAIIGNGITTIHSSTFSYDRNL